MGQALSQPDNEDTAVEFGKYSDGRFRCWMMPDLREREERLRAQIAAS
jgi:hypothetical protein